MKITTKRRYRMDTVNTKYHFITFLLKLTVFLINSK